MTAPSDRPATLTIANVDDWGWALVVERMREFYEAAARLDLNGEEIASLDQMCQHVLRQMSFDGGLGEAHDLMLRAEVILLQFRAAGPDG